MSDYNYSKDGYCFDYMEDIVKDWKCDRISRDMIERISFGIVNFDGMYDYYGKEISSFVIWKVERDRYIDYLCRKYCR